MSVSQLFVALGCNRQIRSLDWGSNGLVAYASGRYVVLYLPDKYKILATLPGHGDRVNSVAWVSPPQAPGSTLATEPSRVETELLSCSVDKTIKLWSVSADGTYRLKSTLQGHKCSVTGIQSLSYSSGALLVATCAADSTVTLWTRPDPSSDLRPVQTFAFAPKMIEAVALAFLPGAETAILAAASVDNLIHLFVEKDAKFWKVASLSGHEDWVRALSFASLDNGTVLLASASQDKHIRLWKISEMSATGAADQATAGDYSKIDASQLLSKLKDSEEVALSHLSHMAPIIRIGEKKYSVLLESVLSGHEDWVTSVAWSPVEFSVETAQDGSKTFRRHQPLKLLSASMDKTMIVWTPEPRSGLWLEDVRVGEVGGTQLGFYSGIFGPKARSILACGYTGGFHLWTIEEGSGDERDWSPKVIISGHSDEARDLDWDPQGQYFISVGKDQTTRAFAPWAKSGEWHEIGRPQVHGHDLNALAFQQGTTHRHRYVSCSEEKVLRVFDAPSIFLDSLAAIAGEKIAEPAVERALTANVPPLGLSNKSVSAKKDTVVEKTADEKLLAEAHPSLVKELGDETTHIEGWNEPLLLRNPPVEDELLGRTLWPETQKLYGHGYDILCVASSRDGNFFASAANAKTVEQAAILVWSFASWKCISEVQSHRLTVVQLDFAPNSAALLAVSRDLGISVICPVGSDWKAVAKVPKAHTRIIWASSWAPDSVHFATGSRDGSLKLWRFRAASGEKTASVAPVAELDLKVSITALAFAPVDSYLLLAVGFESGEIQFFSGPLPAEGSGVKLSPRHSLPPQICHVETVKRLRWRPVQGRDNDRRNLLLASASEDRAVRLFSVDTASLEPDRS